MSIPAGTSQIMSANKPNRKDIRDILYIEDQPEYAAVVEQLHAMVRKKFHGEVEFRKVLTWHEGMFEVERNRPSVILLDLTLPPDMKQDDTLFAFSAVAEKWPPTMILTGNDYDLDLRRRCILAGADSFMLKTEANRNPELLCERLYCCFLRGLRNEQRARV